MSAPTVAELIKSRLPDAPDAKIRPGSGGAVVPEGFFSTTNLPTFVRVKGEWVMPLEPRMDSVSSSTAMASCG